MSKQKIKKHILQAINNEPEKNNIKKVSLFGSYAYGVPNNKSDIDILIEFQPAAKIGFLKLSQIQRNMEKSAGKKIDILTPGALNKYFKKEVLAKAEIIYEK